MPEKDYLAQLQVEEGDKLDYGVKGMKWGVRRSSAELRTAAAKRASSGGSTDKKPSTDHLNGAGETASARYSRLAAQAKSGGASQMSEADLKFFNARTEALGKINKMNQKDPGWLKKTATTVIQQSAQKTLQEISDAVAKKYISGPIVDSIGKHVTKEAAAEAAKKAATKD